MVWAVAAAPVASVAAAGPELAPAGAAADPAGLGTYPVRVFRDSDGLPQNTVHVVTRDQCGYLWVGTQDGAAYYDGRAWHAIDLPDRTRSNFVRAIAAAADGRIWFGSQAAGLYCLEDGAWRSVPTLPGGMAQGRVNALLATVDGAGRPVVWAGTHDSGVMRLADGAWEVLDTRAGLPSDRVWALFEARDEKGMPVIWAGTEGGPASLASGERKFSTGPNFPRQSVNCFAETVGPGGRRTLWAGTYGGGLARREGGAWSLLTTREGMPSNYVTSLAVVSENEDERVVWVGTDGGGLVRLEDGHVGTLGIEEGLPSNAVYCLLATHAAEGARALWVGTRNGGLARINEDRWLAFRPISASPSMPVSAVLESTTASGEPAIWLGTDGGGLARLAEGRVEVLDSHSSALPSDSVQCLLETADKSGSRTLWVGTRNGGLARLKGGSWSTFTRESAALPNNMVQALLATTEEGGEWVLWAGTRGGLARFEKGHWSSFDTASGLPHLSVLSLLETVSSSGERALWVGTAGGLARLRGGSWKTYGAEAGLHNETVQALHASVGPDGKQVLWIGTDGGGVSCLDIASDRVLATLNDASNAPLPNNVIYDILEDRLGRIYLLTNRGVARLSRRPGAASQAYSFEVFTYTWEDGLPRNQCNREAGAVDRQGRIWVGTVGGAAMFDPTRERPERTPKRLLLEGAQISGGVHPLLPGASLAHHQNHLVFNFVLLSLFREGETAYATQLAGLDATRSGWTHEAKKEYRTLPPGDYVFRLWGKDYAGNISGPIEATFKVRPAPWQTWWFAALAGAGLGAVVLVGVRIRLRRHHRREREMQGLIDARTRELQQANELLSELSYLDALTGIANRRRFEERLEAEWKRAVRAHTPLTMLMIDIDHFKAFNDTYGHQRGDLCLKSVAAALSDGLPRAGDSVARYGGEEFAVILPLTDRAGAVKVAEQLRLRIEELGIAHRASEVSRAVTISCGVATFVPTTEIEVEELIRLADEALYRAKQSGRNRTRAEHGEPRSSGVFRPVAAPPRSDSSA
ncbi:MAG: diguanylate cyclase [Acidobacteriota bacterium]